MQTYATNQPVNRYISYIHTELLSYLLYLLQAMTGFRNREWKYSGNYLWRSRLHYTDAQECSINLSPSKWLSDATQALPLWKSVIQILPFEHGSMYSTGISPLISLHNAEPITYALSTMKNQLLSVYNALSN